MSFDLVKILKDKKTIKYLIWVLVFVFIVAHIRGCMERRRKGIMPPRPVETGFVVKKDVPYYLDSFGTISAIASADIRAQVTGKIKEVEFKEGQEVATGDLLFVIDPSEYEAALKKAEAALATSEADLNFKKETYERNTSLFEKGLISKQYHDQLKTDLVSAEAQVELDKSNYDLAKINLDYCSVRSPINGVIGKRQVDVGNIVSAVSGPILVNVKRIDKLYVDFTLTESKLTGVREAMNEGKLKVEISVEGDKKGPYSGELDSLDNAVSDETGTISLRAIVPNDKKVLWPGQFVKVRLILGTEKDALLAPYQAVQIGQQGYYLFAVGKDDKVDLRTVKVGSRQDDMIVVEEGVKEGEEVVTAGQMGLSPGAEVVDAEELKSKRSRRRRPR